MSLSPQIEALGPPQRLTGTAAMIEWSWRRTESRFPAGEAVPIGSLGIVGAGVMGCSIAAAAVGAGLRVVVTDASPEAIEGIAPRVAAELVEGGEGPAGMQAAAGPAPQGCLCPTQDMAEVARCDMVVEAVVEDLWVKEKLLAELESMLRPGAALGTNTSTIPIGRLAARLADPGRLCGIHFFLPVPRRPLVEVVRGPESRPASLAAAVALARLLDKVPLVVEDAPGFLVNRLMFFYLSEALQLAAEGLAVDEVDRAAVDFGFALGPFALMDRIGLDVVLDGAWVLAGALVDRLVPSPPLVALVKKGRLGRKSGAGFYRYDVPEDQIPDPEAAALLARWSAAPRPHTAESILDRLLLPMLLEATRVIEEGANGDPRDIDLAVVFGFGFPAGRGGLLAWADHVGAETIVQRLRALEHLGARVRPTPLLLEMAAASTSFHFKG